MANTTSAIKASLIDFMWKGIDAKSFQEWLYEQDSVTLEELIGADNYVTLICYDYRNATVEEISKLIKDNLDLDLATEFDEEFSKREKMIKAVCVKKTALNYSGPETRNWEVEIGKTYDIIIVKSNSKAGDNHKHLVNYVDKDFYCRPSGFLPIELFDIDLDTLPELYSKEESKDGELRIEPKAWTHGHYNPVNHSFWEDFYDDEEPAVNTYYSTLEELGIKKVW